MYAGFLNTVLKDLAYESDRENVIDGGIIYPRVYILPVDQPAEMALLHHRKSGCDRECGHCDLKTMVGSKTTAGKAEAKKNLTILEKKMKSPKLQNDANCNALKTATSAVKRAEESVKSINRRTASAGSDKERLRRVFTLDTAQRELIATNEK